MEKRNPENRALPTSFFSKMMNFFKKGFSFSRIAILLFVVAIASSIATGFAAWGNNPLEPLNVNFASVVTAEVQDETTHYAVSLDFTDYEVAFDAVPEAEVDSSKANGVLSSLGGKEDLSFSVRLTLAQQGEDSSITPTIDKLSVAFGATGAPETLGEDQSTIRSWIEKGYIAIDGYDKDLLASDYAFTTSAPSLAVSAFESSLAYSSSDVLASSLVKSYSWEKASDSLTYYLNLDFSFKWGSYFGGVNPIYTPVDGTTVTRESLIEGVKELAKTAKDTFMVYIWLR